MNKAYYTKNSSDYWAVSTTRNLTNNFLLSRAKDRKEKDKKKLDEHAELFCQSFLDFLVAVAVGKSQSCFANTNSGKRTFAFLASSEWNLLPDYVTTSTSLSSFKRNYLMGCPSSMSKEADSFYTNSYIMSIISHS